MEIDDHKLLKIISEAVAVGVEIGYTKCAVDLAVVPQYYTMAQAYIKHKRPTVDKWIREKKIEVIFRDGRMFLDRIKLDTLAATSSFNN